MQLSHTADNSLVRVRTQIIFRVCAIAYSKAMNTGVRGHQEVMGCVANH